MDVTDFSATDYAMMARALQLAARGAWTTRPNPMVGCVIVQGQHIGGERWHVRPGQPHAEACALHAAGRHAHGATVYVNLEPCAHHGRTPPCADALAAAGVARVVAALRDPFAQVNGVGFERLRDAGVRVATGLLEKQARALNRGFVSRLERGRPWLRLKLAASMDGRTALASGESKWITGPASRADVQRWRAQAGAILTGAGTVLADDPQLTVRLPQGHTCAPPLRVVLDTELRSLGTATHLREGPAPTLYLHAQDIAPSRASSQLECIGVPRGANGRLDLAAVLALLAARGIGEVQVEAGATLSGAFLRDGLVDELLLYTAPLLLGNPARGLLDGLGISTLDQKIAVQVHDVRHVGADLRWSLRLGQ